MKTVLLAFLLLLAAPLDALAEELAPDLLVRRVSEDVLGALRSDPALRSGDPVKLAALAEAKIIPHLDVARATRTAVGAAWRRATPAQQEELAREFRTLLLRTYSGALSTYRDQVLVVLPARVRASETEVTVRSQIRQSGAEPVIIEYDMEKGDTGWKVFDIRVAGISLVATYRTAFAEEVRSNGIEGLIASLSRKNRQVAAR